MRTRRTLECLGIMLIVAIGVLAVVPAADAAMVAGTVDTVDLAKNKVTMKRGDGTNLTLGVKGFTKVSRNSVPTTLSRLALSDTITAQYFGAFTLKLTVTGPGCSPSARQTSSRIPIPRFVATARSCRSAS